MIIAVYSAKGGVGKTTLAVNLAWASSALSKYRTLLWDLDAQGGASYILRQKPAGRELRGTILQNEDLRPLVRPSSYPLLDVLPYDSSLRHLDRLFHELGKRKRLSKTASGLRASSDRVIIDCPPGLTDTSEQVLRAAEIVIVPLIPSPLSQRALDAIRDYLERKDGPQVVIAPVFSMVDRRRQQHVGELARHPTWPVIPMASAFERVSIERAPIGEFMPRSSEPVQRIVQLWRRIEQALQA